MNNDLNSLYGNGSNDNTNTNPNPNQSTGEDLNSMYNALMTPKVEEPQPTINNEPQNTNEMQPSQSVINNQGLINPELQSNNSSQSNTLDNNNQFIPPQENTNMMNNQPIANQDNNMMNNNNPNSMFNPPDSISNQAIPTPPQESNNNSNNNVNDSDDKYVEAFVGPAYQDFVNGAFNVGAFFLTSLYFFYRKMFLYGLAFFIGQIGLSIILKQFYIAFIVNLACGFLANKIYIGFAKGKVKKLSKKYSEGELLSKCEEKGGTSVGLVFLGIFVEFILALIIVVIVMVIYGAAIITAIFGAMAGGSTATNDSSYSGMTLYDVDFVLAEKYEYKMPIGLVDESSTDGENFKYTYGNGLNICEYEMGRVSGKTNVSKYAENYAKEYNETSTEKQVNNIKWYEIINKENGGETYTYLTEKDNRIYEFRYETLKSQPKCIQIKDQILNTIKEK